MTSTLPFALLAAIGVFAFVDALRPRVPRIQLSAPDQRPVSQRLLDTFFAPAAARVLGIGRIDLAAHKNDLTRRLARAGNPPPFVTADAVLAYRMVAAVLLAAVGGGFGLIVGLGAATLLLMIGLALIGWRLPDQSITNAEHERKEQLMLDAASTMDRLAIYVSSGRALPMAIQSLAERPGGAWVAEFRRLASMYAVRYGDFAGAADEVMAHSGRLPEIVRVLERLKAVQHLGGSLGPVLRQMAADARTAAKLVIMQRGYRNALLMVIPAFFAILAIMAIVMAPGAIKMAGVLGG